MDRTRSGIYELGKEPLLSQVMLGLFVVETVVDEERMC